MRSSRSWEFLFISEGYNDGVFVCLFVCSFLCARAALSVLWVVIRGGSQLRFVFFAYRSFIIFGSARFGLHTTVLVKGLSCFYYDGKLCKFSFLFFFLSSILFDYSNLFFDICISFFLRPIKMAKKNSHQWAWRRLVGWMLSLAEGWLTELRWAWPSKLGKGSPGCPTTETG
jgi:hypothetical protein